MNTTGDTHSLLMSKNDISGISGEEEERQDSRENLQLLVAPPGGMMPCDKRKFDELNKER